MNHLNQLMETTGRVRKAVCSGDRATNRLTFSIRYFNISYRLTLPSDSMEFRAADSDVALERHVSIQQI
jgi:hypothetical protein